MLRRVLVGRAHYILGPFGQDSDLRRHGLKRLPNAVAKGPKQTSCGGCSEKALSVLLHSLWISAEVYEVLRNTHRSRRRGQAA